MKTLQLNLHNHKILNLTMTNVKVFQKSYASPHDGITPNPRKMRNTANNDKKPFNTTL